MSAGAHAPLTVLLSAVEPSGDMLGAALMKALKATAPDIRFIGCGGAMMREEGLESLFPIEPFAVIGAVAALRVLPAALKGAQALADAAHAEQADAAILIDSWSFSRLAAKRIKRACPNTKLIKYVAPQVWASRPQRASTLASLFDGLLTLFDFEAPYFEKEGVRVKTVGSSTFQSAAQNKGDGAALRSRYGLGDGPLLAVLPGSRRGEVGRLAEPFGETVKLLCEKIPALRVVIAATPAVATALPALVNDWPGDPVIVSADERHSIFTAANAALAASGTVATELAIHGTPMVIGYRVGPLTAVWIDSVVTAPYMTLLNIAAGKDVIPEFYQKACRPEAMATALEPLLTGGEAREAQLQALPPLLAGLGVDGPPAAEAAADAILGWIGRN